MVSSFTGLTLEQHRIQAGLLEKGVDVRCNHSLVRVDAGGVEIACGYTNRKQQVACTAAVLVTERHRETALYTALQGRGLETLELIGDAAGPALIADAVFAGHMAARNFERDAEEVERDWFRREIIDLSTGGT